MKGIIYCLYSAFIFFVLMICTKEEDVVPVLEDLVADHRQDDAIRLEVSSQKIVLDPAKRREQALLVTWEPLKEVEALYPVEYLFKMDLTESGFTTAIPTEKMREGLYFKTFTHEELEKLIRQQWNRQGNNEVSISVRVIAQVHSAEKYTIPLYSTLDIGVTPFSLESSPLFLYGSATGNGTSMIEINEEVEGEIYAWRGRLQAGEFKIAYVFDQPYPAFGVDSHGDLVELLSENDLGTGFVVEKEANYAILVDRVQRKISIEEISYVNVYMGGGATPAGSFSSGVTFPLIWDIYRPHIATITINLVGGEMKFTTSLTNSFSGGTLQLMPTRPNASILTDLDVMFSNNVPDWKWLVSAQQAGMYRVVLDTKSMKIQFIKLD